MQVICVKAADILCPYLLTMKCLINHGDFDARGDKQIQLLSPSSCSAGRPPGEPEPRLPGPGHRLLPLAQRAGRLHLRAAPGLERRGRLPGRAEEGRRDDTGQTPESDLIFNLVLCPRLQSKRKMGAVARRNLIFC